MLKFRKFEFSRKLKNSVYFENFEIKKKIKTYF